LQSSVINFEIYDVLGRKVYVESNNINSNSLNHTISLDHLTNGTYWLLIEDEETRIPIFIEKIIFIR